MTTTFQLNHRGMLMLVYIFLQALHSYRDQLQALLNEQWADLRARLNELMDQLQSEANERALPAYVNRMYCCFEGTPAEPFARELFQQAREQAAQVDSSRLRMTIIDPTASSDQYENAADLESIL